MNLKGVFANRPAISQLFLLISFILVGTIITALIGLIPLDSSNKDIYQDPDILRFYQFISAVFTFLLPSLLIAYLYSLRPMQYLWIKRLPGFKIIAISFISMFLFSPTITFTGLLNRSMKLPQFMEPIEKWMQSLEASAEQITEILLANTDLTSILLNLLVVAVAAAITEEFLFRGILQRIIEKWTSNHHMVIWVCAFIFSVMHMQFYGFLPRLLLGAYFGYLLFWSKNIWLPVIAHFTNNAVAVIGMSNESLKENIFISGEIPDTEIVYFAIPAIITLGLFYLCTKYLRESLDDA